MTVGENTSRQDYTKARNKVKKLICKAKKNYGKDIYSQAKRNPKAFWAHVRQKLKTKSGVAPLLDNSINGLTKFDDLDKADILQRQFASVFTREPNDEIPVFENRTGVRICNLVVTEEMVKTIN